MVLIMTMTPLHMTEHGHDLGAVGLVISGHTFGMFGLSPISGRLTDRFGSVPVILAGLGTTAVAAILAGVAPPEGGVLLFVALFLLGYGWNLGYVAGSALLTQDLSLAERTRLQGLTDGLIWSSAAAASLGSGVVVAAASYATLGLLGAALVVVPVLLVIARRAAVPAATRVLGRSRLAGRSPGTTHAARTRAQVSTSSRGTYSSALCATRTSPGPKITHGVPPTLTNICMSAPYGSPSSAGRRPVTSSMTPASPTGSGWSDGDTRRPEPATGDLDGRRVVAQEVVRSTGRRDAARSSASASRRRTARAERRSGRPPSPGRAPSRPTPRR